MSKTRVEYALQISCEKNGCAVPHGDDGELQTALIDKDDTTINGHACIRFERIVTVGDWKPRDS